jgi:DnaJ-class molecular chaperone
MRIRDVAHHEHRLQRCNDCEGEGIWLWSQGEWCGYCDGRGYLKPEFCGICLEPMGGQRRRWKAAGRPREWDPTMLASR